MTFARSCRDPLPAGRSPAPGYAEAPTTKTRQYYSMLGTRGIWENGWKAAALHAPLSGVGHFDQDRWELYHVDEDRSESKDLSAEHPAATRNLHLDNATSGATFTRIVQPSPGQQLSLALSYLFSQQPPASSRRPRCLVGVDP
jgi:arylsulfatase A-like enzyme